MAEEKITFGYWKIRGVSYINAMQNADYNLVRESNSPHARIHKNSL
jgi:hypothetical protein